MMLSTGYKEVNYKEKGCSIEYETNWAIIS